MKYFKIWLYIFPLLTAGIPALAASAPSTEIGVYRNGVWVVDDDGDRNSSTSTAWSWGSPGDIPIYADFIGNHVRRAGFSGKAPGSSISTPIRFVRQTRPLSTDSRVTFLWWATGMEVGSRESEYFEMEPGFWIPTAISHLAVQTLRTFLDRPAIFRWSGIGTETDEMKSESFEMAPGFWTPTKTLRSAAAIRGTSMGSPATFR